MEMKTRIEEATTKRRGLLIGLAAAAILSTTGPFIAALSRRHGLSALVIAFWRDVFTALAIGLPLAALSPASLRMAPRDLRFLAVNGAALAGFNILWTLSVQVNGAAVATLLVYSSGAFTVLLARAFLKERISPAMLGATILVLLGAFLVTGIPGASGASGASAGGSLMGVLGLALGLGSGLGYALYSMAGRKGSERGLSPWVSVAGSFAVAAVLILAARALPIFPASARGPGQIFLPGASPEAWLLLILLAALPTALGFGLYGACLARLPAGKANLIVSSEPLFTLITAYAFLGERLDPLAGAGAALILGAVLLLGLSKS